MEGKHSAYILRGASHQYNNLPEWGGGQPDAESKDVRFRERVFSVRVTLRVGQPTGGLLPWQRVPVGDRGTHTVSSSLLPSPALLPGLQETDVSQMFLTSCLAPCSACVFVLDSPLNNNHFKKSFS